MKPKAYLKKITLGIFLLLLANTLIGQEVGLAWSATMGGTGEDIGKSTAVNKFGHVFTVGEFRTTADFDPNSDTFNLTGVGINIFIQKLDENGNLLWAKGIESSGGRIVSASMTIDNLSNIYITGFFSGTVDFNPNVGVFNVTAPGGTHREAYVLKLDPAGNFMWVNTIGGTYSTSAVSISVDNLGNVYSAGSFAGTVDFDPSPAISNLTALGSSDIYIQKLSTNGAFLWAKNMGGSGLNHVKSIAVDHLGNVLSTGHFIGTIDFDPGSGGNNLTAVGNYDIFIQKLDPNGNLLWVKSMGGTNLDQGEAIAVDLSGNIYSTGRFAGTVDFDPGPNVYNLTTTLPNITYIQKLDPNGNFIWTKSLNGMSWGFSLALDNFGNVYSTGRFYGLVDFDPSPAILNLTSLGTSDIYIQKIDPLGNLLWVKSIGGTNEDWPSSITVDDSRNIYLTGWFEGTVDFDPNFSLKYSTSHGNSDVFVQKLIQKKITGSVYIDFNQNCVNDSNETNISGRNLIINPGNIITTTTSNGYWGIDSLPIGTYSITVDTSGEWQSICSNTQFFTVVHPDSFILVPPFGLFNTNPCPAPDISIHAPRLRPGSSNQKIYVQACNLSIGTGIIENPYVIVELDSMLTVQSASLAYTNLGNNLYRIDLNDIYPGYCGNFWLACHLSNNAIIDQTLCMNAKLYPTDICTFDTIPTPYPTGYVSPCLLPWDNSSLQIEGTCINDSVRFVIHNTGTPVGGDMDCFAPVRLYLDGLFIFLDSIQLAGGDSLVYTFNGNGQTLRIEVDQHPLHPGNSHPNMTIELCGNSTNWTPDLVNIMPHNDADPVIDIFCGLVRGSYDPNNKIGYPFGVGHSHDILPNQELEYTINFQNTGTDTAYTVVIRDTLPFDLDIFTVRSGVSSHNYTFKMYGPRILEWTFDYIMLPDSNVNELESHGFVKFKVNQNADLPIGTVIQNTVGIYFDFNPPIITNTSWHTIKESFVFLRVDQIVEEQIPFKVYPNPTTNLVYIDRKEKEEISILVTDNLGRVLISKKSNRHITPINLKRFAAGIYYLSINDGKQTTTQKIMKQ
jgi:uncharacterized repeat protein (TIGR01451 family)